MKTPILFFVLLLFVTNPAFNQNNAPEVTNVTFNQRTDGTFIVDVYYDLNDADGDTMLVTMQVSEDSCAAWNFSCDSISGDVGAEILSGTGKHIVWDFGGEHPQIFGDQFRVKIIANDLQNNLEWINVPAGQYTYGQGDTVKTINYDFQIMKYQVTNQQYVDYLVEALLVGNITVTTNTVQGYYTGDPHWPAGNYEFLNLYDSDCRIDWNGSSFSIVSGYEDHPVVEVTWFGSWGFAEHYGYRLPTEYEWEKAARGNTGWDYPWGDNIDGSRANYWNSGDPFDNGTTPVGYYDGSNHSGFQTTDSPSPFGAYDMVGNVWDWTDSFYGDSYANFRVQRGGSWYNINPYYLQSWVRICNDPPLSIYNRGFRCSRN